MSKQFAEAYYAGSGKRFFTCINDRIAEGCRVIAAFGDAHYCTVIYEYETEEIGDGHECIFAGGARED